MLTKYCGETAILIPNDIPLEMADAYEYEWKYNGFTFSNGYYGHFVLYHKPQQYKFTLYLKDKEYGIVSIQSHLIESVVRSGAYIIPDAPIKPKHGLFWCRIQRFRWASTVGTVLGNDIEFFDEMLVGKEAAPIEELSNYHTYLPEQYLIHDLFYLNVPNYRYTFFFLSAFDFDLTKPFELKIYLHSNESFAPLVGLYKDKTAEEIFKTEPLALLCTVNADNGIQSEWKMIPGLPNSQYGQFKFWIKDPADNTFRRFYKDGESYQYGDRSNVNMQLSNPTRFEPVPRSEFCNLILYFTFSNYLKADKSLLALEMIQGDKTARAVSMVTTKVLN